VVTAGEPAGVDLAAPVDKTTCPGSTVLMPPKFMRFRLTVSEAKAYEGIRPSFRTP
jgi:hypothetical protein